MDETELTLVPYNWAPAGWVVLVKGLNETNHLFGPVGVYEEDAAIKYQLLLAAIEYTTPGTLKGYLRGA